MKPKSLLLIGGTGFFGKSTLKYFSNSKSLKKKINTIIIISRKKLEKVDHVIKLKKNYDVVKINCDILKLKKLPFADYVIYCAILKNFKFKKTRICECDYRSKSENYSEITIWKANRRFKPIITKIRV